jgi:PST family polysaccharide transporter
MTGAAVDGGRKGTRRSVRSAIRHPIAQNVIGLYVLQMATFVVPLLTLPYVARVLSPTDFGLVVFSQGFAFVLNTYIDWGFTYDGVRQVAAKRDDPAALSKVVERTRGAQLLLSAASLPIVLVVLLVVPKFAEHPLYLLLAWIAGVAGGLAPIWFFMGMEKMRLSSLISLGFRFLGAGLTFVFVKNAGDAWVVLTLFAGSAVVTLICLDLRMYRYVRFSLPKFTECWSAVRRAALLFVGTVAATLYTAFNVVLVGLFEPAAEVAQFGAAERVLRVSLQVLAPLGAAVYPRLAALQSSQEHDRARRLLAKAGVAATGIGLLLAAGLAAFAPLIIHLLFGQRFVHSSAPILRILVLIIPISIIGAIAGSWLVTLHMDRKVVTIVLRAGVFNVALGCLLTPLFGPMGMAWSVVCAEAVAAGGAIIAVLDTRHGPSVKLLARSASRP